MTVHLDHLMVPSRNKMASAKLLAELLGVPWSETGVGDTQHGGGIVYWNEPDGHQWEMLTVSYARQA